MNHQRGQTTAEYAVLIAVVVGAVLAMQIYVKRGAMGRLRDAADQIGDQYSPLKATSKIGTHSFSDRKEVTNPGSTIDGQSTSTLNKEELQQRGTKVTKGSTLGESHITQTLKDETLFPTATQSKPK